MPTIDLTFHRKRAGWLRRWWCGLSGHPFTEFRCESEWVFPATVTDWTWDQCQCGEYSTPHKETSIAGFAAKGGA